MPNENCRSLAETARDDNSDFVTRTGVPLLLFFALVILLFHLALIVFRLFLDREQFDLKNQSRIGLNSTALLPPLAIGKVRRDEELPLRSHGHELQRFCPPFDNLTDSKRRRLSALVGTVKFRAIDESATVVANHRVGRGGLQSGSGGQNLVLQTAGQRDNAFFTFVGGQKCISFSLVCHRRFCHFLLLLFLDFVLHLGEHGLRFVCR